LSEGFELFSYYGEDSTAEKIVAVNNSPLISL
jgi:hypothetical protein